MINDKQKFQKTASQFFNILFAESLKKNCGEIEISGFDDGPKFRSYHNNVADAVNAAYQACQQGLMSMWVSIPVLARQAAKKMSIGWQRFMLRWTTEKQVIKRNQNMRHTMMRSQQLRRLKFHPLLLNHSGGGFHCYWVLNDPVNVSEIGLDALENVNRALLARVKG